MYLKSLVLKGFKSFADTTTIEFEPGICVIVGPNGSGKSNVVDAIAWVLGAQAPSVVRSQKMEDVIFAGTAERPALGRAEVSLTLDNSDGRLPIELSEVTLTRVLFRNGESEYAINRTPCRLLDIQELLSDSGVGRQQHVIVSQGQIDAVLSARPEDRRAIIEEAAGILKYRRRRDKAERRLAATDGNLLRLQDLLREVRRRLKPLERQAAAAKRHRELLDEVRALRKWHLVREYRDLREEERSSVVEFERLGREEKEKADALARCEAAIGDAEAALVRLDDNDLTRTIGELAAVAQRGRGMLEVIRQRRARTVAEMQAQMERDVVSTLEEEAARLAVELREVASRREDLAREKEVLLARRGRLGEEREAFEAELPDGLPPVQGILPVGGVELLGEPSGSYDEPEVPWTERVRQLTRQWRELREALQEGEARVAAAERRRVEAESEYRAWAAREEALILALDEARARAGTGEMAGFEGLEGILADCIAVDEGWEAALDAALGPILGAAVFSSESGAVGAARELDSSGRPAWLLPPGSAELHPGRSPGRGKPLRVHVRATNPAAERILDSLLDGVVVADDLSEGIALVRERPDLVVVTRSGARLDGTSWRVGASTGAATAEALQQAREAVNRAVRSVDDADRELAAANVTLEEARDRERRVAHRIASLVTKIRRDLEARRVALESRLADIDRELTRLEERASVLEDRRGQIESRLGGRDEARRDAEARRRRTEGLIRSLDAMHRTVETVVQKAEGVLRVLESSREAQAEKRMVLRRRVQELRRERASLTEELSALGEKLRQVELRRTQVEVRLEGVTSRIWQEFGEDPEELEEPAEPAVPPGSTPREHLRRLEAELEALGPVNPLALEEFDALSERHDFLTRQLEDVRKSRRELRGVIRGIEREMVAIFSSAFADVSANFSGLFEKLFPGGEGRLVLTDPDDVLNTGVEVVARPSGKNVKKLTLLSGGERSLVALAYLFAVFRSRPSPFYVMDEVEAALDDVNLHRFLTLLEEFRRDAQLVIVTHQKRTMEAADCLYGVTMRPGGSSQVLSERVASLIV